MKPTTVGGKTKGNRKTVSTKAFPLKLFLDMTFPSAIPNIRTMTVDNEAISRDSRIGDQKFVVITLF